MQIFSSQDYRAIDEIGDWWLVSNWLNYKFDKIYSKEDTTHMLLEWPESWHILSVFKFLGELYFNQNNSTMCKPFFSNY